MNETEKQPDDDTRMSDERLDSLLGEIDVPADLKLQLSRIPEMNGEVGDSTGAVVLRNPEPSRVTQSPWPLMILAASLLLAMVGGLIWMNQPGVDVPSIAETPNDSDNAIRDPGENESDNPTPDEFDSPDGNALLLAEIETTQRLIALRTQEQEIARLRAEIAQLDSPPSAELSSREVEAMIYALADQATISLGGSEDDAISDMEIVIKRYPDSRGAMLAQEFLRDLNAQQPN